MGTQRALPPGWASTSSTAQMCAAPVLGQRLISCLNGRMAPPKQRKGGRGGCVPPGNLTLLTPTESMGPQRPLAELCCASILPTLMRSTGHIFSALSSFCGLADVGDGGGAECYYTLPRFPPLAKIVQTRPSWSTPE